MSSPIPHARYPNCHRARQGNLLGSTDHRDLCPCRPYTMILQTICLCSHKATSTWTFSCERPRCLSYRQPVSPARWLNKNRTLSFCQQIKAEEILAHDRNGQCKHTGVHKQCSGIRRGLNGAIIGCFRKLLTQRCSAGVPQCTGVQEH